MRVWRVTIKKKPIHCVSSPKGPECSSPPPLPTQPPTAICKPVVYPYFFYFSTIYFILSVSELLKWNYTEFSTTCFVQSKLHSQDPLRYMCMAGCGFCIFHCYIVSHCINLPHFISLILVTCEHLKFFGFVFCHTDILPLWTFLFIHVCCCRHTHF